ncbi:MAG: outer membrane beta-barrel protein [Phaeodactylibacter sp.]|uniref:outer membrane beta-barrel protein n=1 Tax=Phaeodactylibacter sp. TaxID=1940289 RepID=UPI0032EC6B3F
MTTSLKFISLCCLFLFVLPQDADAQRRGKRIKQRFRASLIAGFNLSQMDGDNYNGFDKFNTQFGIGGTAIINHYSEIGVELLYHSKGARTESDPRRTINRKDRLVDLNYMEIPFFYRYNRMGGAPGIFFEFGGAFARLIEARVNEPDMVLDGLVISGLEDDFNKNELSLLLGLGHHFTEHIGARIRYSFALTRVYNTDDLSDQAVLQIEQERGLTQLRNYYISLAAFYRF